MTENLEHRPGAARVAAPDGVLDDRPAGPGEHLNTRAGEVRQIGDRRLPLGALHGGLEGLRRVPGDDGDEVIERPVPSASEPGRLTIKLRTPGIFVASGAWVSS